MFTQSSATSFGTRRSMRMWLGWSSRVLFPERNTDESLSNVSFPSGVGYCPARFVQPPRQRVLAAARDRLRTPGNAFSPVEQLRDLRMRLQLLQQVVRRELDVAVVEPDHHPDREHVVAHGVDERAAELAVARACAKRPAHRVHDRAERPRDAPDFFHAQLPHLRLLAAKAEVVERNAGEMTLRALGEHGHLR